MIALLILAFNLNLVFSEALNATDAVGNDDLLSMVASTITVYCDINTPKVSALKQTQKLQSTIWDSPTIPPVSMQRYLTRMKKYGKCDDKTFVIALMYLCEFVSTFKDLHANWYNIHRLFAVSFLLAQKLNSDHYYSNRHYARICGLDLEEFNQLEMEFLLGVDFDLFFEPTLYDQYVEEMRNMQSMKDALESPLFKKTMANFD